jgi:hypothetical protein
MKLGPFRKLLESTAQPVVLLEGRRRIPTVNYSLAKRFGRILAATFPRAVFRSRNAEGSDQAFAEDVTDVDASKLRIVAPYATHSQRYRYPDASYDSPKSLPRIREEAILRATIAATPSK